MAKPRDNLRPKHLLVVRARRLERTHGEARREHQEPAARENSRAQAPLQGNDQRRGDQLHGARHQHGLANRQRTMTANVGQKDGHQIDGSVEADAEHETQSASKRQVAISQRTKIDNRRRARQRPQDKCRSACPRDKKEAEDDA